MYKTDKKVVYVDMDNVLVDFPSAFSKAPKPYLIMIYMRGEAK
jgi:hypothetical protein